MTNLRNYVHLSPDNTKPLKVNGATFTPLGEGSGMLGVPGDDASIKVCARNRFRSVGSKVPSGPQSVCLANIIANGTVFPRAGSWTRLLAAQAGRPSPT